MKKQSSELKVETETEKNQQLTNPLLKIYMNEKEKDKVLPIYFFKNLDLDRGKHRVSLQQAPITSTSVKSSLFPCPH